MLLQYPLRVLLIDSMRCFISAMKTPAFILARGVTVSGGWLVSSAVWGYWPMKLTSSCCKIYWTWLEYPSKEAVVSFFVRSSSCLAK